MSKKQLKLTAVLGLNGQFRGQRLSKKGNRSVKLSIGTGFVPGHWWRSLRLALLTHVWPTPAYLYYGQSFCPQSTG